jgi:glycosyltransferase involved in cell wall biosynthesis
MNITPIASVIMPTYNSAPYVREAIESILNQSFPDFELLIYDDCSSDNTVPIIEKYQDLRIRLFTKDANTGYTDSLIMGIAAAKGKYIVRMDSDDISDLKRIEKQVAFLEQNSEYGIVGSWVQTVHETGQSQVWKYPVAHEDITLFTLANAPFAHPSVTFRKEVLLTNDINYSRAYEPCEDYKLWTELLKVTKGKNLDEVLLHYRLHEQQTIKVKKQRLIERSNIIRQEVLNDLFDRQVSSDEIRVHYYFFNEIPSGESPPFEIKYLWKKKLTSWFTSVGKDKKGIKMVDQYWLMHLRTISSYKISYLKFLADKAVFSGLSLPELIRFIAKCLIGYKISVKA